MRAIYLEVSIPRALAVKALSRIWPGVVWSPLSPIHRVDMPEPALPGARWVRVRNHQCGICGTDLSLLYVHADPQMALAPLPAFDRVFLGHEVVGEVVETGPQVSRFEVGDRVVMGSRAMGPNCESQEIDPPCRFCAAGQTRLCENASAGLGPVGAGGGWGDGYTVHEQDIWPVPDDLDDDQASLIEPMAVALHGVLRRPPEAEDTVLVLGAGIIGLLAVQAVKIVEPRTKLTVMARYPHQAEAAERLGADKVISDGTYEAVAEDVGGSLYSAPMNRGMILGGYDVVYDCVGSASTVTDSLRWARAGGSVVMLGISFAELKVDLNPIWFQEVDLVGANTYGVERWGGSAQHTFDLVIELMQEGVFKHEGLITHRFPLEEIEAAVATAKDKSTGSIKVTLELDSR